jgi:UDP-N-acetylglucosamine 2-epimerase (non-hydrolysing)
MTRKILCIVGTRPEVIKMAPVIRVLREASPLSVRVLNSGQHRDLLASLARWFEIGMDRDMRVMTDNQTLSQLTAQLISGFERELSEERPDLVLAQGDTSTVMCAAMSCFYLGIPFAHVEAGLRTYDVRNPFPEEFNRVAVGRLATLHFCPTTGARDNLLAEHVSQDSVHVTGNTVIDALQYTAAKVSAQPVPGPGHEILVTAHRRENFGQPLVEICQALLDLCDEFPQLRVLYPVHPNPNVRSTVQSMLGRHPRITLSEPLGYPELVGAMLVAKVILTDSGGIQEEAPALAKPVLVLRKVTERPEAVHLGVAKLVGPSRQTIVDETRRLLTDPAHYAQMSRGGSPYGDGRAAERIRDVVLRFLGEASAVEAAGAAGLH